MDETRQNVNAEAEKDILFSKAIKAGKRIYYLDVKKDRNEDLFLSITESKKVIKGNASQRPNFEKHKIFLYKEDFDKFQNGLDEALRFARGEISDRTEVEKQLDSENNSGEIDGNLKFDIEF